MFFAEFNISNKMLHNYELTKPKKRKKLMRR